ncbi:MAG TPA: nucleotidyltransferase family protein [Nitrospirales bacterium]|nr:nucleotidyltransferase family protein [Nitrospirales bacterium]HIB54047.1 nucleotidyltransferase family protein [Nitrospirales bacterium]HIC04351.1 nucleotidyltransferase family protein [Nitrospirales bacterium]HIO69382.1 nucleotidyltransferase family protein [Nitrospirales bacterium]
MRAIILAAGFGTRLRPLTNTIPKPLLPVAQHPLIVWNLRLLRDHGITEVIVNLHHLGDQIEQYLGSGSQLNMHITYSREETILGTGGGIKQAEPFLREPSDDAFLVLNGDTLIDVDLSQLIDYHVMHGGLATMVVRDDPDIERWGALELDDSDRILTILGRGQHDAHKTQSITRKMFAGVHVMNPLLLREIPIGQESSIINPYMDCLEHGATIYGYQATGYWSDVGTLERYDQSQQDAKDGKLGWITW